MEKIAIVKVTELNFVLEELRNIKTEVKELREKENLKSYSIQETANLISVSYNTVRKLIQEKKLIPHYINGDQEKGKCTIPAWSIREYQNSK